MQQYTNAITFYSLNFFTFLFTFLNADNFDRVVVFILTFAYSFFRILNEIHKYKNRNKKQSNE